MQLTVEDKTMADHAESCERAWGVNWLAGIDTRYHPEHIEKHVSLEDAYRRKLTLVTPRSPGKSVPLSEMLPARPPAPAYNKPPRRRLIGIAIGSAIRRMQRA